ncbi:MAG: class F sortase [Candidatus Paceibacterota bacterium]|jgi:LPXTG-site transpeptidase (sortase) family protein
MTTLWIHVVKLMTLFVGMGAVASSSVSAILPESLAISAPVPSSAVASSTKPLNREYGVRLRIPSIAVNAVVEPVGLYPDGSLGAPKGPSTLGWFDKGPRPGEKGSAVIDGHFGWKDGIPAVFDHLSKLSPGDKIYFDRGDGTTVVFVVRATKNYGEHEDASAVFASNDGKAHLNLITCGGIWNKAAKSYSNRFVVFADRE